MTCRLSPCRVPEMAQLACVARRVLRRMCYTLLPLLLTYGTSCSGFVCKTHQFIQRGRFIALSFSLPLPAYSTPSLARGFGGS